MLKRHAQIFLAFLMCTDLVWTALLWLGAYWFLFDTSLLDPLVIRLAGEKKPPHPYAEHLDTLPVLLLIAHFALRACAAYAPRRARRLADEAWDLAKATVLAVLGTVAFQNFFLHGVAFSRALHLVFGVSLWGLLSAWHMVARWTLRRMRERGFNQRHVLICGAGRAAQKLALRLAENRWAGFSVAGFLDDDPEKRGKTLCGASVLGTLQALSETIAAKGIDQVICALPFDEHQKLADLLQQLENEVVDVRVVPDLTGFGPLNMSVSDLFGMPLISLREGPLVGWNRVAKRAIDVVVGLMVLAVAAVPMLAVAAFIKLTSKGPVFYAQERMGLDGRTFRMLKFRTMRMDAEADTGAVWAARNDPRRTRLGAFLRRTSLDELPQFFNVLAGQMSVVGPRPERPVFIREFRERIPRYMQRHKIKAGITGWAQVNGWRGNTSIEKRIQYDLYYIEHWSIGFDLWIILLTPFKGLVSKHAY